MTEDVTHAIVDHIDFAQGVVKEVHSVNKSDFELYDTIIIGLSTWYDGDLQSDWEDYYNEFKTIDFSNKRVAFYGLGDQYGYDDYFIDGVGILAEVVMDNGGQVIGHWPTEGYDFTNSKAKIKGQDMFLGLALDEDNQPELTNERIAKWVDLIKPLLLA